MDKSVAPHMVRFELLSSKTGNGAGDSSIMHMAPWGCQATMLVTSQSERIQLWERISRRYSVHAESYLGKSYFIVAWSAKMIDSSSSLHIVHSFP